MTCHHGDVWRRAWSGCSLEMSSSQERKPDTAWARGALTHVLPVPTGLADGLEWEVLYCFDPGGSAPADPLHAYSVGAFGRLTPFAWARSLRSLATTSCRFAPCGLTTAMGPPYGRRAAG